MTILLCIGSAFISAILGWVGCALCTGSARESRVDELLSKAQLEKVSTDPTEDKR